MTTEQLSVDHGTLKDRLVTYTAIGTGAVALAMLAKIGMDHHVFDGLSNLVPQFDVVHAPVFDPNAAPNS